MSTARGTDAATARTHSPFGALLKIAKVPFWFSWVTPFVFGYAASAGDSPRQLLWFVAVALGTCLGDAVCNLHNELVDQEEDAVSQPSRAALVAAVGERTLWAVVWAGYAAIAIGLVGVARFAGWWVALFVVTGAAAGLLYNWGPRFKRRPIAAQLVIGSACASTFLSGWTFHRSPADAPAAAWIIVFFVTVMAFVKDLPDGEGDKAVDAPNLFSLEASALRTAALRLIFLSPYVLIGALVATGAAPVRLAAVIVLAPVAFWLSRLVDRADGLDEIIGAYHAAFTYHHVFLVAVLVLQTSTPVAAVGGLLLLVGRIASLALGLDPRLVEPGSSWRNALRRPRPERRIVIDLTDAGQAPRPAAPARISERSKT